MEDPTVGGLDPLAVRSGVRLRQPALSWRLRGS